MITDRRAFILENTRLQAPPHVPELTLHLADEITPIWKLTEEDLAKIKTQWTEQHREQVKSNAYWLSELNNIQIFKADPQRMLNYDKHLAALTVQDIQNVAKIIFGGPNRATAVLYPAK